MSKTSEEFVRRKDFDVSLPERQLTESVRRKARPGHLGTQSGVNPYDLKESGWGIVYTRDSDLKALRPLVEYREKRIPKGLFHEIKYSRDQKVEDFLRDYSVDRGRVVDPSKLPYYLLLVGGPDAIPFELQFALGLDYAVGRIAFDRAEDYTAYAAAVIEADKAPPAEKPTAALFTVDKPGDKAMQLATKHFVTPMADHIKAEFPGWRVETWNGTQGKEATKNRLARLLRGGSETPNFLMTVSHGVVCGKDDEQQRELQGGLVCQAGPDTEDHRFTAQDIEDDAKLNGLIAFHCHCYGAGTQKRNLLDPKEVAAYEDFLARLPQRMLRQGALAVVAHVDPSWTYTYIGLRGGERHEEFESFFFELFNGYPVGSAMDHFSVLYAKKMVQLEEVNGRIANGETVGDDERIRIKTAAFDARNYVILGDPAARLPVKTPEGFHRQKWLPYMATMTDGRQTSAPPPHWEVRIHEDIDDGYKVEIKAVSEQQQPLYRGTLEKDIATRLSILKPSEKGEELAKRLFSNFELPPGPIRLRLRIEADALHDLPWESLVDSQGRNLATSSQTPFYRYLSDSSEDTSDEAEPIEKRPIKMLVAISRPSDLGSGKWSGYEQFNAEEEKQALLRATAKAKKNCLVDLRFVREPVTRDRLRDDLKDFQPHILHLLGHGRFRGDSGFSMLLQADDETAVPVGEDSLLDLYRGLTEKPYLVYLSSCDSACQEPAKVGRGIAGRLFSEVPAVLAIRDRIPIDAARKFSRDFYEELFKSGMVDRASNVGRNALYGDQESDKENMSLPVLYHRLQDGVLFDPDLGLDLETYRKHLREKLADRFYVSARVRCPHGDPSSEGDKALPSLLEEERRLALVGAPKSGKTAALDFIARLCLDTDLLPSYLPVFVNLKNPPPTGETAPNEVLLNRIAQSLEHYKAVPKPPSSDEMRSLLDRIHTSHPFLILLCGDELKPEDHERIRDAVERFADRHKEHRFVLTARPFEFTPPEGWAFWELGPLDEDQRRKLLVKTLNDEDDADELLAQVLPDHASLLGRPDFLIFAAKKWRNLGNAGLVRDYVRQLLEKSDDSDRLGEALKLLAQQLLNREPLTKPEAWKLLREGPLSLEETEAKGVLDELLCLGFLTDADSNLHFSDQTLLEYFFAGARVFGWRSRKQRRRDLAHAGQRRPLAFAVAHLEGNKLKEAMKTAIWKNPCLAADWADDLFLEKKVGVRDQFFKDLRCFVFRTSLFSRIVRNHRKVSLLKDLVASIPSRRNQGLRDDLKGVADRVQDSKVASKSLKVSIDLALEGEELDASGLVGKLKGSNTKTIVVRELAEVENRHVLPLLGHLISSRNCLTSAALKALEERGSHLENEADDVAEAIALASRKFEKDNLSVAAESLRRRMKLSSLWKESVRLVALSLALIFFLMIYVQDQITEAAVKLRDEVAEAAVGLQDKIPKEVIELTEKSSSNNLLILILCSIFLVLGISLILYDGRKNGPEMCLWPAAWRIDSKVRLIYLCILVAFWLLFFYLGNLELVFLTSLFGTVFYWMLRDTFQLNAMGFSKILEKYIEDMAGTDANSAATASSDAAQGA